jgi:hypothetical protein
MPKSTTSWVFARYCLLTDLAPPEEAGELARLPALERLIARADPLAALPWRQLALAAYGLPQRPVSVAAAIAAAAGLAPGTYLLASPVEFAAGLTQVRLRSEHALGANERDSLLARYARDFAGGPFALLPAGAALLLRAPERFSVRTHEPAAALGRDIGAFLPEGPDAPLLNRHLTELSMWLMREAPTHPCNGFWCWGEGSEVPVPTRRARHASHDPWLLALDALAADAPDGPELEALSIAALEGDVLARAEAEWFEPLERELRAGRLATAALWFAGRAYALAPWQRWRLLRGTRPWWRA